MELISLAVENFQVLSYALTLSHSTDKEHEALSVAVRAYCTWLNALSKGTLADLPNPMKRDPGNYIWFVASQGLFYASLTTICVLSLLFRRSFFVFILFRSLIISCCFASFEFKVKVTL